MSHPARAEGLVNSNKGHLGKAGGYSSRNVFQHTTIDEENSPKNLNQNCIGSTNLNTNNSQLYSIKYSYRTWIVFIDFVNPEIRPYQVLPLRVKVYLKLIVMKVYSTLTGSLIYKSISIFNDWFQQFNTELIIFKLFIIIRREMFLLLLE